MSLAFHIISSTGMLITATCALKSSHIKKSQMLTVIKRAGYIFTFYSQFSISLFSCYLWNKPACFCHHSVNFQTLTYPWKRKIFTSLPSKAAIVLYRASTYIQSYIFWLKLVMQNVQNILKSRRCNLLLP